MTNRISFDGTELAPAKVVCVGRNYVDHVRELNSELPTEPVIFLKPNSAITDELCIQADDEIHYEGEISFLISAKKIVAVAFGLDLTKRLVQSVLKEKGLPWERSKAFDRSAVFSHFVAIEQDVSKLRMELLINGEVKQSSGCEFMINQPADLLKEISSFMTLQDNDVMMSGTPGGVGKINLGDEFTGRIYNADQLIIEQSWQVKA